MVVPQGVPWLPEAERTEQTVPPSLPPTWILHNVQPGRVSPEGHPICNQRTVPQILKCDFPPPHPYYPAEAGPLYPGFGVEKGCTPASQPPGPQRDRDS